jgi:hypothetical protein
MLIMPLLSLYVIQAIITYQINPQVSWTRIPPPKPTQVILYNWFKQEWNKGIHGRSKRYRIKNPSQTDKTSGTTITQTIEHNFEPPTPLLSDLPLTGTTPLALLYILNTPAVANTYEFDHTIERICVDTGASVSLSMKKSNFVHLLPIQNLEISGIASGLKVEGIGILKWSIRDDDNNEIHLFIKDALYVPSAPMGLLCPQQIAQKTKVKNDGFQAISDYGIFQFQGYQKTVHYEPRTRLPIFYTMENNDETKLQALTTPLVQTLTRTQKSLLKWHYRLGHLHFHKIQELARHGKLPQQLAKYDIPLCASCQLGKAHCRPVANPNDKARPIDAEDLLPGDRVSVDQLESPTPGMVDTYTGKPVSAKYHTASLYTDHASRFMF